MLGNSKIDERPHTLRCRTVNECTRVSVILIRQSRRGVPKLPSCTHHSCVGNMSSRSGCHDLTRRRQHRQSPLHPIQAIQSTPWHQSKRHRDDEIMHKRPPQSHRRRRANPAWPLDLPDLPLTTIRSMLSENNLKELYSLLPSPPPEQRPWQAENLSKLALKTMTKTHRAWVRRPPPPTTRSSSGKKSRRRQHQ